MGKTVFITEKFSVAQEYERILKVASQGKTNGYIEGHSSVLNKDVIITWAKGHLIALSQPDKQNPNWEGEWKISNLPMIPTTYKYEAQKSTYSQYKVVKEIYTRKDIDAIYYAGDSGREGIYIQALIRNQIFKTTPKFEERVVWLNSTTEESIIKGIKEAKPYSSYQLMIDSGYMRAISDWLIGMNFTEAFTLTSGTLIHVGRVMTPTLAMVVNRQHEIDNFVKTPYFGIKADKFANWKAVKGSRFFESDDLYNENGFLKMEAANTLIDELNNSKKLMVEDTKVTTQTEYAPYLFNLADLQAYCTKHFKISPSQTLSVVQSLYEKKFTTYPRTDCRFLSSAVAADLQKQGYDVPKRYIDDRKVTDHYALIPTFHGNVEELEGLEKSIYEAIRKRFTDTMLPPYIYDAVVVTYIHQNGERFFENFRLVKQLGFKENVKDNAEEKEDIEDDISDKPIPQKGSVVNVGTFNINEMETKPPVAYTTGSLITAMEKAGKLIDDEELREQIKTCGIGTPATRDAIIENLIKRSYITVDKKQKVAPTEFGKQVISIIAKYDKALVSPEKTADMEASLNTIASGEQTREQYNQKINYYVTRTTQRIIEENKQNLSDVSPVKSKAAMSKELACPCCEKPMKAGKYGWFCECKFSVGLEVCGHKMKEQDIEDLCTTGRTKFYTFTAKDKSKFKAYLIVDKDEHKAKFVFENKSMGSSADKKTEGTSIHNEYNCPFCNNQMKKDEYGLHCSCGLNIGAVVSGHRMTDEDVSALLTNGRTGMIDFKSKAGKPFAAMLVLDKQTNKAVFEFDDDRSKDNQNATPASRSGKEYVCPCCSGKITAGKYGWSCSCGLSLGYEICEEKMTEEDIEALCENGATKTHIFRSKKGTQFKACLIVDKSNKKTVFQYDNDWK